MEEEIVLDEKLRAETEEKLKRYQEMNKTCKKGQILFTGSSLMEMFPIEKFMEERGKPYIIYNRGVGGYRSIDMLRALDIMVYELAPSRIFINIGTNDLSDTAPIEQLIDNYEKILTAILDKLPGVEIYLMAYYPINEEAAEESMKPVLKIRTNEKIESANEEVKKLAEKLHLHYIDVNDALKDDKGRLKAEYTIEGMHIKEEGYRAILDDVLRYVEE